MLKNYIDAFTDAKDVITIPMCFPVCYVPLLSLNYYWINGEFNRIWKKYFAAAANYPFLQLIPSFLNGRFAIDGGAGDNIPLYPILTQYKSFGIDELDLVFVLHFDSRYDYRKDFVTSVPVLDIDLSYCNGFKKDHYDYSRDTIDERIEKAFIYGDKIAKELLYLGNDRKALQLAVNEIFLREHAERQRNLSIDRFFSMLNTVGKLLRNDARCTKKLY